MKHISLYRMPRNISLRQINIKFFTFVDITVNKMTFTLYYHIESYEYYELIVDNIISLEAQKSGKHLSFYNP